MTKYFKTQSEARERASELRGYTGIKVMPHDFGVVAEEAGDPRIQYFIACDQGTLQKDGYVSSLRGFTD